jgi:hypothetical protein
MNNSAPQWLTRTRTQLCGDLSELEQLYSALYSRCSREQLAWRPAAGGWSVAECMEHVSQSILQYLVPMRMAIANGAPPATAENDYVFCPGGWFSAAFLRRIGPQVTSKFKAPRKIRPLSADPEKSFDELLRNLLETKAILGETAHRDLNRVTFRNPFIPVLRFTVATGFLILAAHGRRHLLQAERVTKADGFPQIRAQQSA